MVILAVAGAAALASPGGGALSLVIQPSTLLLSIAVGLASGLLLGTISFEMVPEALKQTPLLLVIMSFVVGFALVYALDLYIHRGKVAGPEAKQARLVERFHRRRKPRGDVVTVIGDATSSEELIEGVVIGVSAAIDVRAALIVGLAIFIDNISEAMSLGALARKEGGEHVARRVMLWSSTIGLSLFVSAMAGWFFLRGMPDGVLGSITALGAGAMFYLTISDLLPEAESRHYQQSSALATGAGFLTIMVLSNLH